MVDSGRALQEYYPPLKERGMVELVGAQKASMELWYLVANPGGASYALVFTDKDGNAIEMADASYVAHGQSEGVICEPDESTKTVTGLTFLAKDYAGGAGTFVNAINIRIMGRLNKQPTSV